MIGTLVVLGQPLADFHRRYPHDRILGSVVPRVSGEDFLADRPLLERLVRSQGVLDGVAQESRESLAVAKERTRQNAAELLADGFPLGASGRLPGRRHARRRIDFEVLAHAPILTSVSIRPVEPARGSSRAPLVKSKRGRIWSRTGSVASEGMA